MMAEDMLNFAEIDLMYAEETAKNLAQIADAEELEAYEAETLAQTLADAAIYDPNSEYSSSSSSSSHDHAYEDSWSFDQGVTGMIVYESDVEKFRAETDGSVLDLTLGSAASGAIEKVAFTGDFSTFSFDDFDLLFEGIMLPDDYDDYDDHLSTDSNTHDHDDMADFSVSGVEIYREELSRQLRI